MDKHTLDVIKIVLMGLAWLNGTVGALVGLLDKLQTKDQQQTTRDFYARLWDGVSRSPWADLAGTVLNGLMSLREKFLGKISPKLGLVTYLFLGTFFLTLCQNGFFLPLCELFLAALLIYLITSRRRPEQFSMTGFINRSYTFPSISRELRIGSLFLKVPLALLLALVCHTNSWFEGFNVLIYMPVVLIIITGACLAMFYLGSANLPALVYVAQYSDDTEKLVGYCLALGYFTTGVAYLLGTFVNGHPFIQPSPFHGWEAGPNPLRMFLINAGCDALTLFITAKILKVLRQNDSWLAPVGAILTNLLVAAVLACVSLWLAWGSVPIANILHTLVGRSSDNRSWDFSVNFWLMHTTFIPVALLCLFVSLAYVAKALFKPLRWFFRNGKENEKPLGMTAALFGLLTVFFFTGGTFLVTILTTFWAK